MCNQMTGSMQSRAPLLHKLRSDSLNAVAPTWMIQLTSGKPTTMVLKSADVPEPSPMTPENHQPQPPTDLTATPNKYENFPSQLQVSILRPRLKMDATL